MRHNLKVKDGAPSERVRQVVDERIARLDRLVPNFPSDAVFLKVFVEKDATRALNRVSLTLDVPGGKLATQKERDEPEEAILEAFAEIERQIIKHKEKLTHSDSTNARRGCKSGLYAGRRSSRFLRELQRHIACTLRRCRASPGWLSCAATSIGSRWPRLRESRGDPRPRPHLILKRLAGPCASG